MPELVFAVLKSWAWTLIFFGCWTVLELIYPAENGQTNGGRARNLFIGALSLSLGSYLGASLGGLIKQHGFAAPINLDGKIHVALVPFVAVWVYDFFYYWFHRLQHTWKPLWALHALHHSDTDLNVTTATRHHWTEDALKAALIALPMGLLIKLPTEKVMVIALLLNQWGYFIHANLRVRLGPLTPFIGGPQLHRVHHSIEARHANKNFAAYLPLWDVMFGTYFKPTSWPKTGIIEHDGKVWAGAAIWPFTLSRLLKRHQSASQMK